MGDVISMAFNDELLKEVVNFTEQYNTIQEKYQELNKKWKLNVMKNFETWIDGVNQMALKNLSVKNVVICGGDDDEGWGKSRCIVATKTGLRQRYRSGTQTDPLNLSAIDYMISKRAFISAWIRNKKSNGEDKSKEFEKICDTLSKVKNGFSIQSMKKKDSDYYGDFNPQQTVEGFEIQKNIMTLSALKGMPEKAIITSFKFNRSSWRDSFDLQLNILYPSDNTAGTYVFSSSTEQQKWYWFFMREAIPDFNVFMDSILSKMAESQKNYDAWSNQVREELQVYSSLMAL
jgi:hypothetical protein